MSIRLLHGAHVPHRKNTAESVPTRMPVPAVVTIPMSMNIGKPANPVVKAGDEVKVGQLIAEAGGFVSSPVYSGVSGKVKKIDQTLLFHGATCQTIVIETDGEQTVYEGIQAPEVTDFQSFVNAVRDSGVVGLGGAGFPTAVKLNVDPEKVEFICINGAECEPYITADTRTMLDDADMLVEGIRLLLNYFPKAKVIIGIENNKPKCVSVLKDLTASMENVEVNALPALYPQGGEKVLIHNTTGRIVPEGKLPIDVGCVVMNTSTLVSVARYIKTGMPLTEKYVTVDGSAIKNPMNVIVPIGTSINDVVEFTGGFKCEPKKVILGGPMMGVSVPDLNQVVVKNTGAILCFAEAEAAAPKPTACIRCGRCVDACPLNLMPTAIEQAYEKADGALLGKLKVNLCMECGCCAFVCPAKHRLVETNKLAKSVLNAHLQALKAEQERKAALAAEKEAAEK
ncbi:MAG: electron transport complex subunit RsxC [Ruminococcaceae bacterium]|nr:electron transport complex subunit RsxC [Oscillospiraceae bacterium]